MIERAETMRDWLNAAGGCDCESLESCGLFIEAVEPPPSG